MLMAALSPPVVESSNGSTNPVQSSTPMKLPLRSGKAVLPVWLRATAVCLFGLAIPALAQGVADVCGCARDALGAFDAGDPSTYPMGTIGCASACQSGSVVLALPTDGVLRFSRFTVSGAFTIGIKPNPMNTPVTLLVAGDVVLKAPACCGTFSVVGNVGTTASVERGVGTGGTGGPGAFRGGRGHGQPLGIGALTPGGNGEGPGGGWGATTNVEAIGGTFTGTPELEPLIGGSGGGGGSGFGFEPACLGGGGGGGGGALVIKANGQIAIQNFQIVADGGPGGQPADRNCAQGGAGGSGGAIRLVARTFAASGTAHLSAKGGMPAHRAGIATAGKIRLESVDTSSQTAYVTDPIAIRVRVSR
jgi:hypothetical protein